MMAPFTKPTDGKYRLNQFMEVFSRESDRGVAVLSMCVLEERIRDGISARLGHYADRMLATLAPRGRWSVMADSAWMLGLLSTADRNDLAILVDVRNRFAHRALHDLSFDHADIVHQMARLTIDERFRMNGVRKVSARTAFMNAVAVLHIFVELRMERASPLTEAQDLRFQEVDDDEAHDHV